MSASLTKLQAADVFSELTPEPVASASLGQVYRGRLISTGQEVAVKVQRPRIGESIAMDMLLLRRLMAAVDRYLPQARCLSSPPACCCLLFQRQTPSPAGQLCTAASCAHIHGHITKLQTLMF